MDRRSFVRACVLAGAGGALGLGALGVGSTLLKPRAPALAATEYYGARVVAGPAPTGVPYVPITVEDGVFVAKTRLRMGRRDVDPLAWHRGCGRAGAPGLAEGFTDDNRLFYASKEEYETILTPWFKARIGEPIRPEDFPDVGYGAAFVWRSQGQEGQDALPGVIVRTDPSLVARVEEVRENERALREDELGFLRQEVFHGEFIAMSAVCTHFCCTAGYKEAERLARARDAWERLYCSCHSATFDFHAPVAYRTSIPS